MTTRRQRSTPRQLTVVERDPLPLNVLVVQFGLPDLEWVGNIQPTPLHRARVVFNRGRTYAHNENVDVDYRRHLQELWMVERVRKLKGPLAVRMAFRGRDRTDKRGRATEPDVTNLAKAVEDAGNGMLWEDDAQIKLLVAGIEAWGRGVEPTVAVHAWRLES